MPSKVPSILFGGVVMGLVVVVVQFIPVVGSCLSCLALAGAGVLAAWHYTDRHRLTITGGQGAGMGAMAALVAGIVDGLISMLLSLMGMGVGFGAMREDMVANMEAQGMDPEQIEMMRQVFEADWFWPSVLICSFLVYLVLGAIGGAIGAATFEQGDGDEPGVAPATTPGEPEGPVRP